MVWAWVGGAIVVIAVVAGAVWHFYAKQAVTGPVAVHAPAGQLISGFPVALILDGAQVSNSYSINYSTSTNQYTAEYYSSSTVTTLYKDYQSYLPKNNWIETNVATATSMFGAIAASQGDNRLQVVISAQHGESQVTITYISVVVAQNSTATPNWINVSAPSLPPHMISGVPMSKPGSQMVLDRYYDDSTGAEHGEYAFNISLSGQQTPSGLYSVYLALLQNNKQITIQSHTPSLIVITEPGYTANITFTTTDPQTVLVDLTYTQTKQ